MRSCCERGTGTRGGRRLATRVGEDRDVTRINLLPEEYRRATGHRQCYC